MGTNYYVQDLRCRIPYDPLHVGKSSGGWCFSLHVLPGYIDKLEDWQSIQEQPDVRIFNEYDETITPEEMVSIICDRSWRERTGDEYPNMFYRSYEEMLRQNYAEPGPNNLLRHRITANCIGHGPGTYDYIIGEFS